MKAPEEQTSPFNIPCSAVRYSKEVIGFAGMASLDDLYDIVEPGPVSWWPLAPGWWILLFVGGSAALLLLVRWLKHRRKNAYRRAALAELGRAESASDVAAILRRTALSAYPRKCIASLHGQNWMDWLEETANLPIPEAAKTALAGIYAKIPAPKEALQDYSREWIRRHPPPEGGRC